MKTVPQVTAQQAQAAVNLFISDYTGSSFTADQAQLSVTGEVWQVPIILAYPMIGSLLTSGRSISQYFIRSNSLTHTFR